MDKDHYNEMLMSLNQLEEEKKLEKKRIYLFGHCDATENLANALFERGYHPIAILDNNVEKQGRDYKGILIESPEKVLEDDSEQTIVCIVARAYAAMSSQLRRLGYKGTIRKLVDYNTYADYSLSKDTVVRMRKREQEGEVLLQELKDEYQNSFILLCPFCALGDIYIMMSFLSAFLEKRRVNKCAIGVIGNACAQVVKLFGDYDVECLAQKDMDRMIQAALYTQDKDVFIPHQDRPYVVDLYRALYVKLIPLELIYCCGVFGLPKETKRALPKEFVDYPDLEMIPAGKSVIFSPYAKSVTALSECIWNEIVTFYTNRGYMCFTNVAGDEVPLEGTKPISPKIAELKSVVERAGTFVGIRSGLCDVLEIADARKIALYPDYNYCDTRWKAIDMYALKGWDNRVVTKEGFKWEID